MSRKSLLKFVCGVVTFTLALVGCGSDSSEQPSSLTDAHLIENPSSGHFESGYVIGQPFKASQAKGLIFKTREVSVIVGQVDGKPEYNGQVIDFSIESDDVLKEFEAARKKGGSYVFKYEKRAWYNPEIEKTKYMLTHVFKRAQGDPKTSLPLVFVPEWGRSSWFSKGGYSSGNRDGVISQVVRRGRWWRSWAPGFRVECVVTLNLSGLATRSRPDGQSATTENTIDMNIYTEEGCRHAERLLAYGAHVDIEYSQDYIEAWHSTEYQIHSIQLVNDEPEKIRERRKIIEAIKAGIRDDEEFRDQIKSLLQEIHDEAELSQMAEDLRG